MQIYIFDIDGTLTPRRGVMAEGFSVYFHRWACMGRQVYLVTGSDFAQVRRQIPGPILRGIRGVFSCLGAEYHERLQWKYSLGHITDRALLLKLEQLAKESEFPKKIGNHIESRPGMINFSVLGHGEGDRDSYIAWDLEYEERRKLVDRLTLTFGDRYDFSIGGDVSIDITLKGVDKAQILSRLEGMYVGERVEFVFFGDRVAPGGNDWPLARALLQRGNATVHSVECWEQTSRMMMG